MNGQQEFVVVVVGDFVANILAVARGQCQGMRFWEFLCKTFKLCELSPADKEVERGGWE